MSAASAAVTPSVARRFASMIYEGVLLFAVAFLAANLFRFASAAAPLNGWLVYAQQGLLCLVFAAYFLWCWLRGGQTLAMKAWRIRLVAPGRAGIPPRIALLRFILALITVGGMVFAVLAVIAGRDDTYSFFSLALSSIGLGWALFDPEGQFLHDRLAGTRLVLVDPTHRLGVG